MSEVYNYDSGTHLTTVIDGTTSFTQSADHGAVGTGQFVLDDIAGTQAIVGQKDFRHTESACVNTNTFVGFVAARGYGRNAGNERAPDVQAARSIAVNLVDINDRLNHRLIQSGGKRPAETVEERLEWLLASDFAPFDDNGRVSYPNDDMDKADYRFQYAGDVLADCANAAGEGWNYFVANYGNGPELVFRNDNTSTDDSSDVRISNVPADVDSDHDTLGANKTFFPSLDAELTRDPENVHSKHAMSYAKGTAVEERDATATAFNGERGGTSSNSNIKRQAQAERAARKELRVHSTEEDVIEVTIQVPASAVNLIYQGFRLQCKFSHLNTEGYGSFTWMRILERTVKPMGADAFAYEIALKLAPQEAATEDEDCTDLYAETPSATYYPLGGSSAPNPSDGVVYYFRPGLPDPVVPTPGYLGSWHFGLLGAGGAGSVDYAGTCTQNWLILMTVGNGTWTIQTEVYAGAPRRLAVYKGPQYGTGVLVSTIDSGDSVEVTISDATDGDCIRVVAIKDIGLCGGKWGWSQGVWVAS